MKKTVLLISMFLVLLASVCATDTPQQYGQKVYAYIDDITHFNVNSFKYATNGINLNYMDTSNTDRYLITPTANPLSEPGLAISSFSLFATYTQSSGGRLLISHDPMTHNTNSNETLDWELAVVYSVSDGETTSGPWTRYCLSSGSVISSEILITLPETTGICSIDNATMHFRFADGVVPTVNGSYFSTIFFTLEAL